MTQLVHECDYSFGTGVSKIVIEVDDDATAPQFMEAVASFMKSMTYADVSIYTAMREIADEQLGE